MKRLHFFNFLFLFTLCFRTGVAVAAMPHIINVSAYDPKEKHRSGTPYSENDVSALRESGASGLIARAGKGGNEDEKCANFLTSADRAGLLPGVYYRLQNHVSARSQADQFIARARTLAGSREWKAESLLLCADFDAESRMSDVLTFMDRIESKTGVVPVCYLENSLHLRRMLSQADEATKAKLRRMPYWAALYSHDKGASAEFPVPGTPDGLTKQYGVWKDWTLWQYGGVEWKNRRSNPKVYSHGQFQFPTYFGKMDRPLERNVFNGSLAALKAFWQRHGLQLK